MEEQENNFVVEEIQTTTIASASEEVETSLTVTEQEETNQSVFDWRQAFIDLEKKRASGSESDAQNAKAPIPTMSIVKQTGLVIVQFSEDMHIIPSLNMVKDGRLKVNGEEQPVFKVEVLPGEDSDLTKLNFSWHTVEMTKRKFSIQIVFE